jgi:ATP-dependent DNA helicase Q1
MANYCIDFTKCKRTLIAKHFNDSFWDKNGQCNQMCDFCKNIITKEIETVNCIKEANIVVDILSKHESKEKRLTANKLSELVYNEISKSKKSNYSNNLKQNELETLILELLMKQYLKEDYHFTPYSTIVYLVNGNKSAYLKNEKKFDLRLNRNIKNEFLTASDDKTNFISNKLKNSMNKSIAQDIEIVGCEIDDDKDDIYVLDSNDEGSSMPKRRKTFNIGDNE